MLTAEDWLNSFDAHTRKAYEFDWQAWQEFCDNPDTATRADVEAWVRELKAQEYAPASIRRKLGSIASYYSYVGVASPTRGVKAPKSLTSSRVWLNAEELRAWVRAAELKGGRSLLVARCLLHGLRAQEMCDLKLSSFIERNNVPLLRIAGKGDKVRLVRVMPELEKLVRDRLEDIPNPDEFLVLSRQGKQLTYDAARFIVAEIARLAGLPKVTPHDIRASVADVAYRAGTELTHVQSLLGHANINTTMTYIQDIEAEENEALPAVSNLLA